MKAAIIIGHDIKSQGAKTYNGMTEYQYNSYIASLIDSVHKYKETNLINSINKLKVFDRNNGWPNTIANIKELKPDICMELHFNSFHKEVQGVETLCLKNDTQSIKFGQLVSSRISEKYRIKLRHTTGVLEVKQGDRGHSNLEITQKACNAVSVLVEPAFMNHVNYPAVELTKKPLSYAELLYCAIEDWALMVRDLDAIF